MDIINPEIIVLGKRFYRSNILVNIETEKEISYKEYDEEPCYYEDVVTNYQISCHGDDCRGSIYVPSMFICYVIGKGGESKKRIEFDTQTIITVPKMGTTGLVNVKGRNPQAVDRALTRISMLIDFGRGKSQFTHFFSIQISNSEIQSSFERFKETVLHSCVGDRGVVESVFQRTYKLHVTICVMVLADQKEVENAHKLCSQFQIENMSLFQSSLKVRIRGVDCMNDDPCEVRVLYGKIERDAEGSRLQTIADRMVDYLVDQKVILRKEYDTVTLHMTLMNSNYNRDKDLELDNIDDGSTRPRTIDCSNIIKKYSDWEFGELDVDEVQLSKRFTVEQGTYYQSVGSLRFACENQE